MASRQPTGGGLFHNASQRGCRVFLRYAPPPARVQAVLRENLGDAHAHVMRPPRWTSPRHLRSGAQFEVQRHLVASLKAHPWRVHSAYAADVELVITPHERLCGANHDLDGTEAQAHLNWLQAVFWAEALLLNGDSMLEAGRRSEVSGTPLRVLARLDSNCLSPYAAITALLKANAADVAPVARATAAALRQRYTLDAASKKLNDMLQLVEYVARNHMTGSFSLFRAPTPFVLPVEPRWLVEPSPTEIRSEHMAMVRRRRWSERPLLFFAGHMPKLYISRTRYHLWRQLHDDPRATVHSYDINCTIGLFAACHLNLSSKEERWFTHDFCAEACPDRVHLPYPCMIPPTNATTPSKRLEVLRARLIRQCRAYRQVDFETETPAIRRSSARNLPRDVYLNHSLHHRFCLVAMGDQEGTPKRTEMMAVGGAGGCIPLIVLPHDGSATQIARMLPYSRWLDYCKVAWLVSANVATSNMQRVLEKLETITQDEASEKIQALRAVRNAFIWRLSDKQGRAPGLAAPSAADAVLEEICHRARRYRTGHVHYVDGRHIAGGNHERCLLRGK